MIALSARARIHIAGIVGLIVVLGIARFAYTPMLPLMRDQAGLGMGAGGWLAAANYAGYFTGVFVCGRINDLAFKDRLYRAGMLLAVISTALMPLASSDIAWSMVRFIAGLSTAFGMILGGGLVMNWLMRNGHRPELGIHFSGIGLGIVMCSLLVLMLGEWLDWRGNWYALSLLGLLLLVPAWWGLPRPQPQAEEAAVAGYMQDRPPTAVVRGLLMGFYFCAGVGFVVTSTFIVAIVNALPGMDGSGFWVFLLVGCAAAPSCILWDLVARRIGAVNALLAASLLHIAGILLPLAGGGLWGPMAGAVCFGMTFAGIVSLVMGVAGRFYPTRPAKMMSTLTIAYGIAQITAPALTGWIGEITGSYAAGLYIAALAMIAGVAMLGVLRTMPLIADRAIGQDPGH